MSKIDRMQITGIRSFSPNEKSVIEFYTPLTVIVGINGSGKTTIVESLKYVTAGIQPPNSKVGGAFVHDPNLAGDKEVKGQVKLQFQSTQKARMVVTRTLSVTVKKATRSLKTLEGSLVKDTNSEKTTVSTRVAELDTTVPYNLGVSAAVLDNVIFCHQEESLWPMSEPTTLKKKFDEIFEAQKYTKAIDNIKQIRKKHNDELGKYKLLAQHAKEDRDRAEKARKKSEQLSDAIEQLRDDCRELQDKMDMAQARAASAWKASEEFSQVIVGLTGLRSEQRNMQDNVQRLRERLQEVSESDEWLENTLREFEIMIAKSQEDHQVKKERWIELKDEIKDVNDQLSAKLTEKGEAEHDKAEHMRQLSRRLVMVKEAATKHQMRGYDDLSDERIVEEFLYRIKKTSKDQTSNLEKTREKADGEKQEALTLVNRLVERKAALQDSKTTAKEQIAQCDREGADFQRKADAIQVDEGTKAAVESRIDNLTAKLLAARNTAQRSAWETKLRDANAQLQSQESEVARLNEELIQAGKKADDVASLSHLKQTLKETQRSLDTLLAAHGDNITQLIGNDWEAADLEKVHQTFIDDATRQTTEAVRNREATNRDVEQIQFKLKTLRDEIVSKKTQASNHERKVTALIGRDISDYETVLDQATENVNRARDSAKGTEGILDYLNKCLENFNAARPACRTCHRAFKNAEDPSLAIAKKRMLGLIEKAGKQIDDAEVQQAEEAYAAVINAGTDLAIWKKLTTQDIPSIEQSLSDLGKQKDDSLVQLEARDRDVQQTEAVRKDLEAASRIVSSITRHATDITSYKISIDEMSAKQSQQGGIKTLEEIREELSATNEVIRVTKKTITNLTTAQSCSKNDIHEWELTLRDHKSELASTESQLEKKAGFIARVDEIKALVKKHRDAMAKVDANVQNLEPEILTAQEKQGAVAQRWSAQINELTRDARELTDTVNGLEIINDQIKSYLDRGGEQRLNTVRRDIKTLQSTMDEADKHQVQLSREITKLEDTLRNSESTENKYADNLRYRRDMRRLEELGEEIQELESRNAELDRDRLTEDARQATLEHQLYSGQREGLLGQMKTMDGQLKEIIDDFKTDFVDAPRRYKEAHIKVETTKAAVSDLQVYGTALDNAIMKFHGLKMEQVNEIIHQLWQKTYQGTDVDSIMIRSDSEAGGTATRGRSYNYRVVMIKQGIEMDMRGRCSAGQKVLASIIIRLALADVFSQHCGLIALDEPTTNLDHANIMALARSLHDIIKERRTQRNFQLIVITHDEEFLHAMSCGDFCESYWHVDRDRYGNSYIEWKNIRHVVQKG